MARSTSHRRASSVLEHSTEWLLLLLTCLAPWVFGAVHPLSLYLLFCGLSAALLLAAWRLITAADMLWRPSLAELSLAGIVLLGLFQSMPLSKSVLQFLSPATAELYQDLLPHEREQLPTETAPAAAPSGTGATLSVYRFATRVETAKWLALFALLVLIRTSITEASALRHLAVCALINGTLLSLLGLNQFFGATRNTVYWAIPTLGQVFGPFINRNHFAFHANLCLALGLGLLLGRAVHGDATADASDGSASIRDRVSSFVRQMLDDSRLLWMTTGIGTIIAAIVFSLSRGGAVSMLLVLGIFGVWLLAQRRSLSHACLLLAPIGLALGLVLWFGMGRVSERLESTELSREGRFEVWADALILVRRFPLFGAGYGTFPYVEPIVRTRSDMPDAFWDYAHNDYLQLLTEGGLIQLGLVLVFFAAVGRGAFVRYRGAASFAEQALCVGAIAALSSAALHSLADFSMHVPANALLATYIAALLVGQQSATAHRPTTAGNAKSNHLAIRLAGRVALACAAVIIAGLLWSESRGWELAERYRLAALRQSQSAESSRQAMYLARSIRFAPRDASLRLAYFDANATDSATPQANREQLRQLVIARDLCPLDAQTQLRLAEHSQEFARADSRSDYISRAVLLRSFDPTYWYVAGLAQFEAANLDDAKSAWRESLRRSSRHLDVIVDNMADEMSKGEILDDLLPSEAESIYLAALRLLSESDDPELRIRYFKAALAAWDRESQPTPDDYFLRGELLVALDRTPEAMDAYLAAVRGSPNRIDWRLRLAEALLAEQEFERAGRELQWVLTQRPGYPPAQALQERLSRESAEFKVKLLRDRGSTSSGTSR